MGYPSQMSGNPKSLESVILAVTDSTDHLLNEFGFIDSENVAQAVRDHLAQALTVAFLRTTTPHERQLLEGLCTAWEIRR